MNRPIASLYIATVLCMISAAARADEGMWLLNAPPVDLLNERYGFEPTPSWLEHLQKSCVRFETGGSGSIISADGLVMTNHHVGEDMIAKLSTPEHDLLETGFYAPTRDQELKCPDLELRRLWSIEDVTDRVNAAVTPGMPPADSFVARRRAMAQIEAESLDATGLLSEVVTLYQGGLYHLYRYKAYTDIRLVFAPESTIAFFGGDNDNFEYPRFNLDCCFFRIYEDGKPLKSDHYLSWSAAGASESELVFVLGHPARTQRLNTVAHLKFLRDVDTPATLQRLWRREVQLQTFSTRSDEHNRIASSDLGSVANSRKAYTGIMQGLLDPAIMQRKAADEQQLRAAVNATPQFKAQWGDAWDQIAASLDAYREIYLRYTMLESRRSALRSDLFGFARHIVRLAEELPKPSGERLREYRDAELPSLYLELYSPAPIYDSLEINRLSSGLSYLAETIDGDDPLVKLVLAGQSPQVHARELVDETSLRNIEGRRALVEGGASAVAASKDPLILLAVALDPECRLLRQRYEDEVEGVQREAYAKIAAAQFAILGENLYPDATFTLRLSFGPVRGHRDGGSDLPPFTDFAGLFQRYVQRHGEGPFELPDRWLQRRDRLKLDTPYNFVSTPDIIGGNSGSPVVNTAGEVVGLIFDGNLYSLTWDIAYSDVQGRAIAVDSRGIVEALHAIYQADALVKEVTGK